jgi:small-conductance mechanosensitive channel
MQARFARPGRLCGAAFWLLLLAGLLLAPAPAFTQPAEPVRSIEALKSSLDEVETALASADTTAARLAELRPTLIATRDDLRARLTELEPRLADVEARLKQLGPAPPAGGPAELPAVAAERDQLSRAFGEVDGAIKQARTLLVRADQLGDRITERRQALYAREVFARGASAFAPSFWADAGTAVPDELRRLQFVLSQWTRRLSDAGSISAVAGLLLIALLGGAFQLRRWWRAKFQGIQFGDTAASKAQAALLALVTALLFAPGVVVVSALVLDALRLLTPRMNEIAHALVLAMLVASFARAAAGALLAPRYPERRLIRADTPTARRLYRVMVWGGRILGAAVFLQLLHRGLFAPIALVAATNALFAAVTAALLIGLALRSRSIDEDEPAVGRSFAWVQPAAWAIAAVIAGALLSGYVAFAGFFALRTVVGAAIVCALTIVLFAIDAVIAEFLNPETRRGRAVAANLGLPARNIGIIGTILSGTLRVLTVLTALLIIVGPWEASTVDFFDAVQSVPLAFRIGEISISLRGLLNGLIVLCVVLLATRVTQRWLQNRLLPQTALEPSLQLSVVTVFGYFGVIAAVAIALGALGLDLQKIALIAGALSVGIGFGLQSIVSNFVSGLILLAERPIRIGDTIVVKGEEGWVRRIRVRATEIETFDRASVLVPNSELITGMVKNWTRANTLGRVTVKVGVGYDSDPEQVRDLLLGIATDHSDIVRNPPPGAFLMALGESALEFELRCVVANVDKGLTVKSDLHFAILKRFRDSGIEIPYPHREIHVIPETRKRDTTTSGSASAPTSA